MRLVVQRVDKVEISVNFRVISAIGAGLLVFLGIEKGDTREDADYLVEKLINLRIFDDGEGKMNLSLQDKGGGLMIVSQFTLLGDCRRGRRPSFTDAEDPGQARAHYLYFIQKASERIADVQAGEFQAMMKVELVNDGPVTLLLDSRKTF